MSQQSTYNSVFVVGATGTVGSFVTKALLKHPNVNVSILSERKVKEKPDLKQLCAGHVTSSKEEELVQALKGVDVIVSTLSGAAEIIFDGQVKLLQAAKKVGVKKFIPTSFGVDYSKLEFGEFLFNDPKKKFTSELVKSGLEYVQVHTGIFAPYAASLNLLYIYDKDSNTVKYYGELNVPVEITDLEDVEKYTAEAALRHDIKYRDISVKGDSLLVKNIAHLVYGDMVVLEQVQTVDELKKSIDERLQKTLQPQEIFPLIIDQLRWVIYTQKARSTHFDNQLFQTFIQRLLRN